MAVEGGNLGRGGAGGGVGAAICAHAGASARRRMRARKGCYLLSGRVAGWVAGRRLRTLATMEKPRLDRRGSDYDFLLRRPSAILETQFEVHPKFLCCNHRYITCCNTSCRAMAGMLSEKDHYLCVCVC